MLELALLTFTSTSAADLKAKDLLAAAYATFYIKIHIKISLNYLNSGIRPFQPFSLVPGKPLQNHHGSGGNICSLSE